MKFQTGAVKFLHLSHFLWLKADLPTSIHLTFLHVLRQHNLTIFLS